MSTEQTDFKAILKALVDGDVSFVVIGQVAANLQGSAYATFDVDVCYERSPENIRKLVGVLRRLNAKLRVARSREGEELPFQLDERSIQAGGNFTFETDCGPLDCLAWPAGVDRYEELVESAKPFDMGGTKVLAASLDHLLLMRRKAGRRKDLERTWELEEIKRIQESGEAP